MDKFARLLFSILAAVLATTQMGCQSPDQADSGVTRDALTSTAGSPGKNFKTYDPKLLSCDPFGGSQNVYYNLGLATELYYLPDGSPQYTNVADYFTHGTKLPVDIFFGQVDVPTRMFSEGFPSAAGPSFQKPDGTVLVEWFGLRYRSVLRLAAGDVAGKYQFGILSDDGAILSADLDGSGGFATTLVNNDGTHPTRLGCGAMTVRMDNSTQMPIRIDYYQGPRYHISNILLWRQIPDSVDETKDPSVLSDPSCGMESNTAWFDPSQVPSVAQPAYNQLLQRGWKVVAPENFLLPDDTPTNPCCVNCGIGV